MAMLRSLGLFSAAIHAVRMEPPFFGSTTGVENRGREPKAIKRGRKLLYKSLGCFFLSAKACDVVFSQRVQRVKAKTQAAKVLRKEHAKEERIRTFSR